MWIKALKSFEAWIQNPLNFLLLLFSMLERLKFLCLEFRLKCYKKSIPKVYYLDAETMKLIAKTDQF